MSKSHSFIKITFITLATLWILGCLAVLGIVGYNIYQKNRVAAPAPSLVVQPPSEQDPSLLALADQIKADVSHVTLKYTDFPEQDVRAYFSYNQVGNTVSYMIEVRPGLAPNRARQSFAHEYYHYIWMTHPESHSVIGALQGMYAADTPMHDRMQVYVDRGLSPSSEDFANELFAIYCTEVYTPTLESSVATECMKWVDLSSITTVRSL